MDPHGVRTTYWFQYGPTASYGQQTPKALGGPGPATPTAQLSRLQPVTSYHFRLVATSAGGTGYGSDQTLTTLGYYSNPVYGPAPAPDPFVLDNGGVHRDYWAFTTGDLFPVLHSTDLVSWTSTGTAMLTRPSWVVQTGDWHPWSPNVLQVPQPCPGSSSGPCYIMYYTGLSAEFNTNCVAVATASAPNGPYADQGPLSNGFFDNAGRPIGCGDNEGYGMIDPSPLVDPVSGQAFLYGSEDFACPPASVLCTSANSVLQPTISVIQLSSDLLGANGPRAPLFSGAAGSWEAVDVDVPTVEGPMPIEHNGTYYLLYSGGGWRGRYAMGYATAPTPVGPFTKDPSNPLLSSTAAVTGPGGGDTPVVGPHGGSWLVYHGRDLNVDQPRTLRIDPFGWKPAATAGAPDVPVISGPTSGPQAQQP